MNESINQSIHQSNPLLPAFVSLSLSLSPQVRGADDCLYTDVSTFSQVRPRWLQQCRALLSSSDVERSTSTIRRSVSEAIAILTGDMGAISANASSWLEVFVASLIHRSPHSSVPQFEYLLLWEGKEEGEGATATAGAPTASIMMQRKMGPEGNDRKWKTRDASLSRCLGRLPARFIDSFID